jgi:hypothetical protein
MEVRKRARAGPVYILEQGKPWDKVCLVWTLLPVPGKDYVDVQASEIERLG